MNGRVDESLRALIDVAVRRSISDEPKVVTVWVDTPFNGFLALPQEMIDDLGLQQEAATEALLADGSRVTLESFVCHIDWFGDVLRGQAISNNGKLPLLGTELLATRKLLIDYGVGIMSIH